MRPIFFKYIESKGNEIIISFNSVSIIEPKNDNETKITISTGREIIIKKPYNEVVKDLENIKELLS